MTKSKEKKTKDKRYLNCQEKDSKDTESLLIQETTSLQQKVDKLKEQY